MTETVARFDRHLAGLILPKCTITAARPKSSHAKDLTSNFHHMSHNRHSHIQSRQIESFRFSIDNNRHRSYTGLTFCRDSSLTQCETNIGQCASMLAWSYVVGRWPTHSRQVERFKVSLNNNPRRCYTALIFGWPATQG